MSYEEALEKLSSVLAQVRRDSPEEFYRIAAKIRAAKEQVRARYVSVFTSEKLDQLSAEEFRSFLLFKNNQHWDNLHRQGGSITADMPLLRQALNILVDESMPIRTRLNILRPNDGKPMIRGLGRAVITGILQVLYPNKYGVLNNTAEAGMKQLGLWPDVQRAASFGEWYEQVNQVLLRVAHDLGVDLWTLDMLWWRLNPHVPRGAHSVAD